MSLSSSEPCVRIAAICATDASPEVLSQPDAPPALEPRLPRPKNGNAIGAWAPVRPTRPPPAQRAIVCVRSIRTRRAVRPVDSARDQARDSTNQIRPHTAGRPTSEWTMPLRVRPRAPIVLRACARGATMLHREKTGRSGVCSGRRHPSGLARRGPIAETGAGPLSYCSMPRGPRQGTSSKRWYRTPRVPPEDGPGAGPRKPAPRVGDAAGGMRPRLPWATMGGASGVVPDGIDACRPPARRAVWTPRPIRRVRRPGRDRPWAAPATGRAARTRRC